MIEPAPDARQAATLVIFREAPGCVPQILMMERSASMAFAGGAVVFPGGAVDSADITLAEALASGLPVDEAAARIAAVRETLEESGLALGLEGNADRFTVDKIRRDMLASAPFGALLEAAGLRLDLSALVPFARWHPSSQEFARRIYDTRFYLARLDEGSHEPTADTTENVHLFWATAREVLELADRGEVKVIFPTRRNLERLAQFGSYAEIVAHARALAVEKVTPWIEEREDGRHLCIPKHLGYPITSEPLDGALRG